MEYKIQGNTLKGIADAIRTDTGTTDTYEPENMAAGVHSAYNKGFSDGAGQTASIVLQSKQVTPSAVLQQITADSGYDGLSEVDVAAIPADYLIPSGVKNVTENGSYDITKFASVLVSVAPTEAAVFCKIISAAEAVTAGNITLITDEWIASNYTNSKFFCGFQLISDTADTSTQNVTGAISSNSYLLLDRYAIAWGGNAGSSKTWSASGTSYKASYNYTGTGYAHCHADSSGSIIAHAPSSYTLKAGTYAVWYGLAQ